MSRHEITALSRAREGLVLPGCQEGVGVGGGEIRPVERAEFQKPGQEGGPLAGCPKAEDRSPLPSPPSPAPLARALALAGGRSAGFRPSEETRRRTRRRAKI